MIQHSHSIHTPDGNCENNRKYEIMFNRGCSQRSFKFQVVSSNLVPNFSFYLRLQSKQQSFQTQIIVHKFVEFIFELKNQEKMQQYFCWFEINLKLYSIYWYVLCCGNLVVLNSKTLLVQSLKTFWEDWFLQYWYFDDLFKKIQSLT